MFSHESLLSHTMKGVLKKKWQQFSWKLSSRALSETLFVAHFVTGIRVQINGPMQTHRLYTPCDRHKVGEVVAVKPTSNWCWAKWWWWWPKTPVYGCHTVKISASVSSHIEVYVRVPHAFTRSCKNDDFQGRNSLRDFLQNRNFRRMEIHLHGLMTSHLYSALCVFWYMFMRACVIMCTCVHVRMGM